MPSHTMGRGLCCHACSLAHAAHSARCMAATPPFGCVPFAFAPLALKATVLPWGACFCSFSPSVELINLIFGGFVSTRFASNRLAPCNEPGWRGVPSFRQISKSVISEYLDMDNIDELLTQLPTVRACAESADTGVVSADGLMPLPAADAGGSAACVAAAATSGVSMPCIALAYNSVFQNNTGARNGGAVSMAFLQLTVRTSDFLSPAYAINGAFQRVRVAIVGSTFASNTASRMGGALVLSGSEVTDVEYIFDGCQLTNNTATTGGAISMPTGLGGVAHLSLVAGTRFVNNSASDKVRVAVWCGMGAPHAYVSCSRQRTRLHAVESVKRRQVAHTH